MATESPKLCGIVQLDQCVLLSRERASERGCLQNSIMSGAIPERDSMGSAQERGIPLQGNLDRSVTDASDDRKPAGFSRGMN